MSVRHPEYRPAKIRRPAVVLHVSLDQSAFGQGGFSRQERTIIPDRFEVALIEAFNARGIFPADVTLVADRASGGSSRPIDRLDRGQALARARQGDADILLIVDMRLGRRVLVYCRGTRRPVRARSTVLAVTVEAVRVPDGTRLLLESPTENQLLTDMAAECTPERNVRRRTLQELIEAGVAEALRLLMRR